MAAAQAELSAYGLPIGVSLSEPPVFTSCTDHKSVMNAIITTNLFCWLPLCRLLGCSWPLFLRRLRTVIGPEPQGGFPWSDRPRWDAPRCFAVHFLSVWAFEASTFGLAHIRPPKLLLDLWDFAGACGWAQHRPTAMGALLGALCERLFATASAAAASLLLNLRVAARRVEGLNSREVRRHGS